MERWIAISIGLVLLLLIISYSIYGLYWLAAHRSHSPTGTSVPTGCTGSGYTGAIIVQSIHPEIQLNEENKLYDKNYNYNISCKKGDTIT